MHKRLRPHVWSYVKKVSIHGLSKPKAHEHDFFPSSLFCLRATDMSFALLFFFNKKIKDVSIILANNMSSNIVLILITSSG